jgi:hypothetical protein
MQRRGDRLDCGVRFASVSVVFAKEGIVSTTPSVLFAVLVFSGSATLVPRAPRVPDPPQITGQLLEDLVATQNFQRSVAEYVVLHQLQEHEVQPVLVPPDIGQIQRAVRALQIRIQVARVTARPGDIITPEVARMFRRRIATCLTPEQWKAVLADQASDEEGEPVESPPLYVNMEWPEQVPFDFVPPQLLQSLPRLPQGLQYRIIGRSLVLWDHHANLIVDFLPGAFVPTSVPSPKFDAKVPGGAPGSQGATTEHIGNM